METQQKKVVAKVVNVQVLIALLLALLGASLVASPASAATQTCNWQFFHFSNGARAYNSGHPPHGECWLVQARVYVYYGGGVYGWVTGSQSDDMSTATPSSYNSIENRQARVRPADVFSPWHSHLAGYRTTTVVT